MFLLIDETISIVYGTHSTIIGMVRYSNRMARMTDRETEQRMLSAALSLVHDRGISTGLESLPFDEVIRAAEVSRTSAYRRWPQRERFYGEVLTELARGATLPAPGEDLMISVANILAERAEHLDSPQDHRDLVVELLRVSIGADFDIVSTSPQWRTYRLLLASYQGISDPAVREAVTEALVESDQRAVAVRSRVYAQFAALLGYRLVAPLNGPDGFELMSRAAGASMMGVLARISLGDSSMQVPRPMRAFGSSTTTPWTPGVYMVTSTVLSYIEVDPGVVWDRSRIADILAAVATFTSER